MEEMKVRAEGGGFWYLEKKEKERDERIFGKGNSEWRVRKVSFMTLRRGVTWSLLSLGFLRQIVWG